MGDIPLCAQLGLDLSGRTNMAIRVVLADDHRIVRDGLRALLEREAFSIVGEASDGVEAVRVAEEVRPDVVLLDVRMPVLGGLDAARLLQKSAHRPKTILLTRHDEAQYVTEALHAGVDGYVLKSQAVSDLVQAIEQVSRGGIYLSPSISRAVVEAFLSGAGGAQQPLTSRERQVLRMVGEGKSTKEVARLLGISANTAESHRFSLMRKLDIHQTAGLVRYAIRCGLLDP
jgi:DNA-binding NarL/FixJ family response regulator